MVWMASTSAGFAINYNRGEFVGLICTQMEDNTTNFEGKIGKNCRSPATPASASYFNSCFNTLYATAADL
jgi:hypothetical protein